MGESIIMIKDFMFYALTGEGSCKDDWKSENRNQKYKFDDCHTIFIDI